MSIGKAIAAAVAKRDARKDVRGKRQTARKEKRTAVKKIRSETKPGKERRQLIGATRRLHSTDKEGKKGGHSAAAKYMSKTATRNKRQADRKTKHKAKVASRVAKKTERKSAKTAVKSSRDSMKEKQKSGTYKQQDLDFFKRNAKQRGMKRHEYYGKYVK